MNMATPVDDKTAIAYLHETLAIQKAAFLKNQYPSVEERRGWLHKLASAIMVHREQTHKALLSDFGAHPRGMAQLMETMGPAGRAMYDASQLEKWMTDEVCDVDKNVFGDASARIIREPKGVIGMLVPFNFPMVLSLGPLSEMLAAGNRVIIKPSEYTPETSKVLKQIINSVFTRDEVEVVLGAVDLGIEFCTLKYDHILYTGSPAVGRLVMAAAAKNLVPVTLELGGKCPTIITPGSVTERNVDMIIGTKMLKNGQVCVAPDTTYVPAADVPEFIRLSKAFFSEKNKNYSSGSDSTGIVTPRHLERLEKLLADAKAGGANIIEMEEGIKADPISRRMPLSMVIDPHPDLAVAQEEIFGPIMCVIPYYHVKEVAAKINDGERPLGLYIFSEDQIAIDFILRNTKSGGVCINSCATQSAINSMGFGGIGSSGMGRHGGYAGFCEFSNPKGVFQRSNGSDDMLLSWRPPYALAESIVEQLLTPPAAPKKASE